MLKASSASVAATSSGSIRYSFALPNFKVGGLFEKDLLPATDLTLTLQGVTKPASVNLLAENVALEFDYTGTTLAVKLPAAKRTKLVDGVQVELAGRNRTNV
jgi:hypothetical protein